MNINLKLKKRREIINKEKSYQRSKIIRQYKQQMINDMDLNNKDYKDTNQKLEDFKLKEEKRKNYEKNLYGEDINEPDNEIEKKEKIEEKKYLENKKEQSEKKEKNTYNGNKRTREQIDSEKQKKLL